MLATEACLEAGAKVISIASVCNDDEEEKCNEPLYDEQFKEIYNQGVLIVAGSGNSEDASNKYPSAFRTVMSVSAVYQNKSWYEISTRNDQTEIAAPGV
jgi:hypothetical protein